MEWACLGNASHLFSVIVLWPDREKPRHTLQRLAWQSVISLTWPPGYEDRVYRALNWLGDYYPDSWMGSLPPPALVHLEGPEGPAVGQSWASRKYSQLSASGQPWPRYLQQQMIWKPFIFGFEIHHIIFFTADFPSYEYVAYVIKISWHFPSPQGQGGG